METTQVIKLNHKETGRELKRLLSAEFPGVKFSVRTGRGRGTDIGWTDGPTTAEVDALVGSWESEGFDSMQDLRYPIDAVATTVDGTKVRPTTYLLLTRRGLSDELQQAAEEKVRSFNFNPPMDAWDVQTRAHRFLSSISYPTLSKVADATFKEVFHSW